MKTHLITIATALLFASLSLSSTATAQAERVRQGKWSASEVPDGWVTYETPHYQIQSQVGKSKAKRLGRHMETMFKVYKKQFPPGKSGFIKKPVKMFKDRESFLDYGAPPSAAAYYTWGGERELVGYDTGRWMDEESSDGPTTGDKDDTPRSILDRMAKKSKMDLLGVMSHEGWHQYFHWYVVSRVSLPSWIDEGMGDYFYAARPIEVEGKKALPAEMGRMNETRLPLIRLAAKRGELIPLEKFIRMDQRAYYSNPGLCYAQGWALCQFLLHHKKKKYRKVIPTYIRTVRDDTNVDTVTKKCFRRFDLKEMDAEFSAWIQTLKLTEEEELEKKLEDFGKGGRGGKKGKKPSGEGAGGS